MSYELSNSYPPRIALYTNAKDLVRDYTFIKVLLRSFVAHWDLKASWEAGPGPFNSK